MKLLTWFIFFIFIFSCQMQQISNIDSVGRNIICFGDSLTFGYNAEGKDSYPAVLSKMLNKDVINAGRSGDTTQMALERLEKDVLEKDPLLAVVILGANDFLGGVPQDKTFNNLRNIIRSIKTKGAIVALGQLGPFGMYTYKKEYEKLAKQENVLLIKDIMAGIFGNPELMSDEVHPNAKGYAKMAEKVYKSIKPILEKNKNLRSKL